MNIVFVDDDDLVRQSVTTLLTALGATVLDCSTGESAIRAIEAGRPDAVLVDLNMPGMDGFELAGVLRREFGPELRLVALTGRSTTVQREEALSVGFDVFLTKPISGVALLDALSG